MKIFLKYYLPLILWVFLIFYFSSIPNLKSGFDDIWDIILRKAAHIFEFAVLAVLLIRVGLRQEKGINRKLVYIVALLFGVLYAMIDEYHQTFIIGRRGSLTDVFIDSLGVMLGTGVYLAVKKN